MLITPPTIQNVSNDLEKTPWFRYIFTVPWRLVVPLVLFVVGLGAIGLGVWSLYRTQHNLLRSEPTQQPHAQSELFAMSSSSAQSSRILGTIHVDVSGAIRKPGLYQIEKGSRVAAAIDKAGGFAHNADTQFISQELNLAKVLEDGEKLYIYTKQEADARRVLGTTETGSSGKTESQSTSSQPSSRVSLNTASQTELESLNGIGEKRAMEIIAARPFTTVEELLTKKLVSEAVFNEIKGQLTL